MTDEVKGNDRVVENGTAFDTAAENKGEGVPADPCTESAQKRDGRKVSKR